MIGVPGKRQNRGKNKPEDSKDLCIISFHLSPLFPGAHVIPSRFLVFQPVGIHPRDEEVQLENGRTVRTTFLPIRVGYAVNLHKVQGATLDHVTIWLDAPYVEAAGYVALSRVRRDADWRFVGILSTDHFVPASNV